ncbi:patatin-like phospholipase family protein [Candidatus Woesearchaeota archaeon]|nr:patatin-like phospholipase family protein [Candidatus Woesearchaeota archaeon]
MAKIGLVLSGGGFKGLAHVGVLKVLEENNIRVDAVAGCSMGSIIGTFFAAGKSASEIEEFVVKQRFRSVLNFSFSKLGIDKMPKMRGLIEGFTGVKNFNELKKPLYINAVNISKQKEAVFSSGNLFDAIRASISVPGIFAPYKIGDDYYVDGGVLDNIPFSILPKNIDKYIIVDVVDYAGLSRSTEMSISKLMESSVVLMMEKLARLRLRDIPADNYVMIKPMIKKALIIPREKKFRQIIKQGELAAWKKIHEIKHKLLKK